MLDHIVTNISGWIIGFISAAGYLGVALLMALESACVPIPSEIIMPFAGYLASTNRFSLVLVATAGALGCNLGSTVAYAVGAYGGRPLVERWGRYLLLSPVELGRADRYFQRFGAATVLIGRLLPVVRTFVSLPAGVARMSFWKFEIYTFIGSWPWCFVLAYIGFKLGQAWNADPRFKGIMHSFDIVVLAIVVLAIAYYAWRLWRVRASEPTSRS